MLSRFRGPSFVGIAVLGGLAVVVLVSVSVLSRMSGGADRSPLLSIANLDIGEVWASDALEWPLEVTNCTKRDLRIDDMVTSCRCRRALAGPFDVPAGATVRVLLSVDVRANRPRQQRGDTAYQFSTRLVPILASEGAQGPFVLKAVVRSPLAFSVEEVRLGDEDAPGSQRGIGPKVIFFRSAVPVAAVHVLARPPKVSALVTRDGERTGRVEISRRPDAGDGAFQCDLLVTAITTGGDRLPAVRLPVAVALRRQVDVTPAVLWFSPAPVGTALQASIVLSSPDDSAFTIESVRTTSTDTTAAPGGDGARSIKGYTIRQRVASPGVHSEAVEFVITAEGGRRETIALPVNYLGWPTERSP